MIKKISILGTAYTVVIKKYDEDEAFKKLGISGYCDEYNKQLIICDVSTCEGWEFESKATIKMAQDETIRHEIVHAFLVESGLACCSSPSSEGWAKNEEMIDWFALQGIKIYEAWREAEVL